VIHDDDNQRERDLAWLGLLIIVAGALLSLSCMVLLAIVLIGVA
jgi:hypothetical protein